MVPPVHHVVHDASGKSITLEYLDGKLRVFDNPLGVLTNSPGFDWHMTNLRNYVNLSARDVSERQFGPVKVTPTGIGSGLLGMPGDMTPPSRFVRAAAFSQALYPSDTGYAAVLQAFHVLNNFDIPRGIARTVELDAKGNRLADYTLWTSANDLKSRRFYFRTFENSQIRMVDLMSMKLDAREIVTLSMKGDEEVKALTN
jgi:choloylglycine hydrolase